MLEVEPGREDDFRHLSGWLAASEALDRAIEAAGPPARPACPPARLWREALEGRAAVVRRDGESAATRRGLRARFAACLAALAVALHPQAASAALGARLAEEPR